MSDDLVFADDDLPQEGTEQTVAAAASLKPWRVLIVDDEVDIHAVTRIALANVTFKGRGLTLLSAYSGAEGFDVLSREDDIALVFLDVVMEREDAGLVLAKRIRTELNNQLVRIVLRTGQPGQAPEERVIVDYDINDYKAKTDLTKQKLFTVLISSLRAYEGLLAIHHNSVGLRKILDGASNLYQIKSLKEFASGVLDQIGAILDARTDGALCLSHRHDDASGARAPSIVAATGIFADLESQGVLPDDNEWSSLIKEALREKRSIFSDPVDVLFINASNGHEFAIVLTPPWPLGDLQRALLGVFCDRIAAAFDNLYMFEQLQRAQEAAVIALADLAESRDPDTGGHVQRVCKLTETIVKRMGAAGTLPDNLPARYIDQLGIASMLHDVGKVATPDAILLKAGRHDAAERAIMEAHVTIGERVLQRAASMVEGESYLTLGSEIAGGHHEHFDGSGYPRKLKGEQIPLGARIVAVVDVFDALLHRRPYKEPWMLADVLAYLRERNGTQFDPDVVEALVSFVETEQPDWLIGDGH